MGNKGSSAMMGTEHLAGLERAPFKPNLWTKFVMTLFDKAFFATQGYHLAFGDEMFRTYGVKTTMKFGGGIGKMWAVLSKRYGEGIAQILIGSSAMWKGCEYCSVGHVYGGNVYYFKKTGRLFPLSERDIPKLQRMPDKEALDVIKEKLAGDEWSELLEMILRVYDLGMDQAQGERPYDEDLRKALAIWRYVTECSLMVTTGAVPTAPIAKDKDLIARYDRLREQFEAGDYVPPASDSLIPARW